MALRSKILRAVIASSVVASTSARAEPPGDAVEEVVVHKSRATQTPTEVRLDRSDIRQVPGAFGDPSRAIDISPSLTPIVSGLPFFYIRGAPPSAVGYYVDEVRVPYLYHFGIGPGVIQPSIVEDVALHPAAFPGRFGRFAGGIVAVQTRDPAEKLRGEGQIRFYDAGVYVEAPFADGRASAGVGGRYSYTGALLSLVAPNATVDYRDYNARASYQLTDRLRASVFTFGAYDYLSETTDGSENALIATEFHRLDLRLDHRGAGGGTSRVAATVGFDRTAVGKRFARNVMTGVRARHRTRLTSDFEAEVGADVLAESYAGDVPSRFAIPQRDYERASVFFAPRTDTTTGGWVSASYRPGPGWDLVGTMRADVFTSDGRVAIGPSPRASARVPIASRLAFVGAIGITAQAPASAIPLPAVGFRGLPGGLGRGYQKSAGIELSLPLRFQLRAVGYHHTYLNLRDFAGNREKYIDENNRDFVGDPTTPPHARAQAYGIELQLGRRLSERFAAFVSASMSRSELGSTATRGATVSAFDRTFVAQAGAAVDLGRNWRTAARFLTYSGWPELTDDPVTSAPTGNRFPVFYRADVRLEKRWLLESGHSIAFVVEVLNAIASRDVVGRRCFGRTCEDQSFGPLLIPNIGVEGAL